MSLKNTVLNVLGSADNLQLTCVLGSADSLPLMCVLGSADVCTRLFRLTFFVDTLCDDTSAGDDILDMCQPSA